MAAIMRLTTGVVYVRSVSGSFSVTGPVLNGDGTAAAPAYSFTSDSDTGFFREGGALTHYTGNGVALFGFNGDSVQRQIKIHSDAALGWTAGESTASLDLSLFRDAANVLAQRNGTNAQTFRVYNTYTDASNYERAIAQWASNILSIGVEAAGTGTLRQLRLQGIPLTFNIAGVGDVWNFSSSGHLLANTDNTYDIGASGATRPRNYFGGGTIDAAGAITAGTWLYSGNGYGVVSSSGTGFMLREADGVIRARNDAGTGFTRLILGPNDASGVAIGKSGTTIEFLDGNAGNYVNTNAAGYKVTQANGAFGSNGTTGTLITNDAQTVAQDAVISLGTASVGGYIVVCNTSNGEVALFALSFGGATIEVSDPSGTFSVTKDNANTINIYWDAGNSRYELQQKRAAANVGIRIIRLGV